MKSHTLLVLISCFAFGCGDVDEPRRIQPDAALQADVQAILATGVVAVQAEHSYGEDRSYASAGPRVIGGAEPVAHGDRFRIASTTKTFTMALVLMLAEEGALSLDDTVENWLPGLVSGNGNDGASITLRQLLAHRSGLNNHVEVLVSMLGDAESRAEVDAILARTWLPRELVALATSLEPLDAPGRAFHYSDTGYVLLGLVIEAATGRPWDTALRERITTPLQLRDTYVPSDASVEGPHMHGYSELPFADGLVDVTEISPSSLDAAAAIISTPADVNAFFEALLRGHLFGPAQMAAMKDALPTGEGSPSYGLGLSYRSLPCGGGFYAHDGDTLGYHARNGVTEDGKRAVCVAITGGGQGDFDAPSLALIERVLCASD
jgi:D-alanyl-D-alanine carboxypeptidase